MTTLICGLLAAGDNGGELDRHNQPQRLCHFAQVLMEKREFAAALERFETALLLQPDLAIAWAGKGQVLYCQKRYPEALRCLAQASQLVPDNTPALMREQIKVLCKLRLFTAAARCCSEVLQRTSDWQVWGYQCYALYRLGCYRELLPAGFELPVWLGEKFSSCPVHLYPSSSLSTSSSLSR